ncbi:hypothetical protein A3D85_00950 [Candidatus Amesbacteria bacterium RIFCSPHIGHO2_02_FULL_47_9]|uniref:DUF1573 domain-containing protein n=1 Tax=Candidatus Amesbacteria bacterium RIFCSPHIGHO2_01_FULL_48_32b TaxID=1797253 RepID=A0A1F4YFX0_9BACT|nr:MAG: hypothetical protein A2876_02410 [Candidatus Amesbacteria bacterium RIFCSPHIGHO2_01_FULL_48_32b]OGD04616.1 MAG: hypothetical protein A3D85_00950 [Candidatus Amesbacteria bacterium RIFCSPHIGHO2_02_FULL_47_9]OGD07560.1 MAG: hypothetical protein A2899_04645 [Candidatus Amesbacteria bacterium RIFCSPLOWO2_01_FULL_49_25]
MNLKVILIGGLITVLIIAGAIVVMSRAPNAVKLEKSDSGQFFTDHASYDWGEIDYGGGVANHVFEIKNSGSKPLKLANVKTSCMCTTAKLIVKSGNSPIFRMHQVSDWQGTLEPGETAQLEVNFDPTFHGPSGTGPIERIISVETSDPAKSNIEFNLKGVVIKNG